jgi:hypothetical protein
MLRDILKIAFVGLPLVAGAPARAGGRGAEGANMAKPEDPIQPQTDRNAPQIMASRGAPAKVPALVIDGVRYESGFGSIGRFRAVDDKSGRELWSLTLYEIAYDPMLETDVQDVFVIEMKKGPENTLLLRDEHDRVYRVDLAKRASSIATWPVRLRDAGRPLSVEILLSNDLDRKVSFDKPSIAVGGRLQNDLFEVKADGKPVPYGGMMKKRVPPDSFLELAPRGEYRQIVDLSQDYPVPRDAKTVEVRFRHTNHFSPDDFQLESKPLKIVLADAPPLPVPAKPSAPKP